MSYNENSSGIQDPREQLANSFRDFFVHAIEQQGLAEASGMNLNADGLPAGSLYKLDNGFLKILLEEPAYDEEFDAPPALGEKRRARLPLIWVSVEVSDSPGLSVPEELPSEEEPTEEVATTLEVIVYQAKDIFLKRVFRDSTFEKKRLRDDCYVPDEVPDTVASLLSQVVPDDAEQIKEAQAVLKDLRHYDIRTIRANVSGAA